MHNDVWLLVAIVLAISGVLLFDFVFKIAKTETEFVILIIFCLGVLAISADCFRKYAKLCMGVKK